MQMKKRRYFYQQGVMQRFVIGLYDYIVLSLVCLSARFACLVTRDERVTAVCQGVKLFDLDLLSATVVRKSRISLISTALNEIVETGVEWNSLITSEI